MFFIHYFTKEGKARKKREKKGLTLDWRCGILNLSLEGGDNLEKNLAELIVEYRAKHNISQEEFANRTNLTKQTIGAIENGRSNITKLTRAKIMRVISEEE